MNLTKREKILLQILIIMFVFALLLTLFFTPALTSYMQSKADSQSLAEEQQRAEGILNYPGLDARLLEEQKIAKENYTYFYSVLNSYTIDGIVNELLQREKLKILNLEITPYEDAFYDFAPESQDIEEGADTEGGSEDSDTSKVLVKSTINLDVEGEYGSILNFIDGLNETSTCLRVNSMTIADDEVGLSGSTGISAILKIYVYGINVTPIAEVIDMTE